jgi:hypothetical protein
MRYGIVRQPFWDQEASLLDEHDLTSNITYNHWTERAKTVDPSIINCMIYKLRFQRELGYVITTTTTTLIVISEYFTVKI